jgi:hypothetical protein
MVSNMSHRAISTVQWIIGITLTVPLVIHAYLGTYSRYIADDFCTAGSLKELGFLQSQAFWYETWSGRYAFTFVINIIESLGPWTAMLMPAVIILAWISGLALFFRGLARRFKLEMDSGAYLLITALIVFGILSGVGNPYQSIYWLTGVVTYSLPLVLVTIFLAWLLRRNKNERHSGDLALPGALALVIAFVIGGFSETYVAVQITLFTGLLASQLILLGNSERYKIFILSAALLGSVIAMVVIIVAPGNAMRAGIMPDRPDLLTLLDRTWLDFKIFTSRILNQEFWTLALISSIPALTIIACGVTDRDFWNKSRRQIFLSLLGLPVFTVLLVLASIMPYEYGISSFPDDRVLVISRAALYTSIAIWSAGVGVFIKTFLGIPDRPLEFVGLIGLLLILGMGMFVSLGEIRSSLDNRGRLTQFAESWDERHEKLTSIENPDDRAVEARSLTHMGGLAEIGYDPDEWINRCVAQYYGLEQVVAK